MFSHRFGAMMLAFVATLAACGDGDSPRLGVTAPPPGTAGGSGGAAGNGGAAGAMTAAKGGDAGTVGGAAGTQATGGHGGMPTGGSASGSPAMGGAPLGTGGGGGAGLGGATIGPGGATATGGGTPYCATQPDTIFCDDFDEADGQLAPFGFDSVFQSAAGALFSVSPSASAPSAPNALRLATQIGTEIGYAQVSRPAVVSSAIRFSLRIHAPNLSASVLVLEVQFLPGMEYLGLALNDIPGSPIDALDADFSQSGGSAQATSLIPIPKNAWSPVIDITVSTGVDAKLTIALDGDVQQTIVAVGANLKIEGLEMRLGTWPDGGTLSAQAIELDNVVVRLVN